MKKEERSCLQSFGFSLGQSIKRSQAHTFSTPTTRQDWQVIRGVPQKIKNRGVPHRATRVLNRT